MVAHQNQKLYFYKLLALPTNPQPDAIYLIKGNHNTYNMYITDNQGNLTDQRTKVIPISKADLDTLANTNSLLPGELWYLEDVGRLAVPTSNQNYNMFFAVYVGDTPPTDTSVIWFDTSLT